MRNPRRLIPPGSGCVTARFEVTHSDSVSACCGVFCVVSVFFRADSHKKTLSSLCTEDQLSAFLEAALAVPDRAVPRSPARELNKRWHALLSSLLPKRPRRQQREGLESNARLRRESNAPLLYIVRFVLY